MSTLAAAAGAAAIPLLPPATPSPAIFVLAAAFGFFTFGWYGPWVVHVAESGQDDTVGLTLGLAMTANQLGIVAAPPLFGALLDLTGGYTAPWLAVSALLVATAARLGLAARRGHA